jgi:cytidylate kinase
MPTVLRISEIQKREDKGGVSEKSHMKKREKKEKKNLGCREEILFQT